LCPDALRQGTTYDGAGIRIGRRQEGVAVWDDVRLYELEFDEEDFDFGYWLGVLEQYRPGRVLDLACGAGRITLPLAECGAEVREDFRITGIDSSAPMIGRARERLAGQHAAIRDAVTFGEGDMRDFDLGDTFDLIVLGFNSFAYLHTIEDQLACLASIRRHLAPGGHFALDLIVPQFAFLAEAQVNPPPIRLEMDHALPEKGIAGYFRSCADRYDASTQTISSTYFYEIHHVDGRQERTTKRLDWHMYYPNELQLLLGQAGFSVVERFGSYDRTPFTGRSKQYLWTMTAG
jgi:SAM-dependent methyltransferase